MPHAELTNAERTGAAANPVERGLDWLALPVLAVLILPLAGGILRLLHDAAAELFWRAVRSPWLVAGLCGFEARKTMRLRFIVLTAGRSRNLIAAPVADEQKIRAAFEAAKTAMKEKFGIEVLSAGIATAPLLSPAASHFPVRGGRAVAADCGLIGSYYQLAMLLRGRRWSFRRLIGYGAPLTIFVAGHVHEGAPLVGALAARGYIVLPENRLASLPLAISQACGSAGPENSGPASRLTRAWVRNSRFCTYL
jgi:hypothetical protein